MSTVATVMAHSNTITKITSANHHNITNLASASLSLRPGGYMLTEKSSKYISPYSSNSSENLQKILYKMTAICSGINYNNYALNEGRKERNKNKNSGCYDQNENMILSSYILLLFAIIICIEVIMTYH